MTWLQPIGEIFVIEDQKYLNKWLGTEGSQFDEADSDYDKSCEITEYIDKISVNNRPILILGDEPMQMIIKECENEHYLIRWSYASVDFYVEENIQNIALSNQLENQIQPSVEVLFQSNDIVVHNASITGSSDINTFKIKLNKPNVIVTTYKYEPDEETLMICHRFSCK